MLGMKKESFHVRGMSCGHCEAKVKNRVGDLEGVARVEATASAERVEVTLSRGAEVERDAIARAIQEAGFEVVAEG